MYNEGLCYIIVFFFLNIPTTHTCINKLGLRHGTRERDRQREGGGGRMYKMIRRVNRRATEEEDFRKVGRKGWREETKEGG